MATTTPASVTLAFAALGLVACATGQPLSAAAANPEIRPADPALATTTPSLAFVADQPLALANLPRGTQAQRVGEAEALLERDPAAAADVLRDATSPAADLIRGRALRQLGQLEAAAAAVAGAARAPALAPFVVLERGRLAIARGDDRAAAATLLPLLGTSKAITAAVLSPLVASLAVADPEGFLRRFAALEAALPDDVSARSRLLGVEIDVLARLGRAGAARAVAVQRYLEEPVATETPADPPAGATVTAQQLLGRAEVLLAAHRNERVLEAIAAIPAAELSDEERCRVGFARGLAHRKLHHYVRAEQQLTEVVNTCTDEDLVRRAMYIVAKVISIASGLRAVDTIEDFAARFAGHSMVDDVLFWAGDLYQRRGRFAQAAIYYQRVEALADKGDYCADARWRFAWMAYRAGDGDVAARRLERLLLTDGCVHADFDRARARYWLGRIASDNGRTAVARQRYGEVIALTPLGFYGQLALARLLAIDPDSRRTWQDELRAPSGDAVPPLCPAWLASNAGFARAVDLLAVGLRAEAKEELLAIAEPPRQVIATSQAATEGSATKRSGGHDLRQRGDCGAADPGLLIALLLDRAGAYHESHRRLRTEFADVLARLPTPQNVGLFKAAYPLAYRDALAAAERAQDLPPMFLQALAREESAFDQSVVSWAGAYGLTQLLLSSGQRAGALLRPPVTVTRAEDLLDPWLNARLGGALMATLMHRYRGNVALSLVAYNASESFASTLWQRHQTDGFDRFAEEITIRETRGYVKRVLRTFGIYRWLYTDALPALPVAMELPNRS